MPQTRDPAMGNEIEPQPVIEDTRGKIYVEFNLIPKNQIGPYDASIRMVKHVISNSEFLYGVAACAVTTDKLSEDLATAKIPVDRGWLSSLARHRLRIDLPDGRKFIADCYGHNENPSGTGWQSEIAFMYVSSIETRET